VTRHLNLHGYHQHPEIFGDLEHYGSDAPEVERVLSERPGFAERIHERLGVRLGEAAWAVRNEMARTVDDVLARRTRSLVLDARAAIEAAPRVAEVMADELEQGQSWIDHQVEAFHEIARGYLP
jgi:glycerol-3-phosphate dehydrogenase